MKKFLKTFVIVLICVCTCLTFAGCGKKKYSPTTNVTTNVTSNGGIVLRSGNWIYFVNGTKTNDEDNNREKTNVAAIFRVATDDSGEIIYKPSTEENTTASDDEDEEEVKEFQTIELVVQSFTGFENGSIYIFGDYIYYATPCTSRNRDGEMLVGKTEFKRYDLVNHHEQKLYTTQSSDDTISYTYYKQGETLNLVVYEKNNSSITSLKIDKKVKTNFVEKDVTSCVLSEHGGDPAKAGDQTDNYIYWTTSYDQEGTILRGNRTFRILPNGEDREELVYSVPGETVTLMAIKDNNLLFSVDSAVYHQAITSETKNLDFTADNVVCYKSYTNIIFYSQDGENIYALIYETTHIAVISWVDGVFHEEKIDEFDSGTSVSFVGLDGDNVIYQVSSTLYRIKYKNIDVESPDGNEPVKLSSTSLNAASGLMAPEILNGYVYGFSTVTNANITYLYRFKIDVDPSEDVKAAEFIGVKE